MQVSKINFDDHTIRELFGFEDAESENPNRLKEYFLKKDTYERVAADLPLRILVGHKGTGKSALFRVAMSEEEDKGNLPILIKPDDVAEIGLEQMDFLSRVRKWKQGLLKIIGEKVFEVFGINDKNKLINLSNSGLKILSFLVDTIKDFGEHLDLSMSQNQLMRNFLDKKKIVVYIDDLDRGWEGL